MSKPKPIVITNEQEQFLDLLMDWAMDEIFKPIKP
jgi:hypothetical protein